MHNDIIDQHRFYLAQGYRYAREQCIVSFYHLYIYDQNLNKYNSNVCRAN